MCIMLYVLCLCLCTEFYWARYDLINKFEINILIVVTANLMQGVIYRVGINMYVNRLGACTSWALAIICKTNNTTIIYK